MMRRTLAQVGLALVLALVGLTSTSAAAEAAPAAAPAGIGTDCLHPPDPASPSSGVSAWIDSGPEKPLNGDPFAAGSKVTVYDVYGYAGTKIVRYDDGCNSSFNLWNDLANFNQGITSVTIAITTKLYRTIVNPAFGSIFDPIQQAAQRILGRGLFLPLIGLTIGFTAVYYAMKARKADVAGAATGSGKTLGIVALGIACVIFPLTIGAAVDKGIGQVVSTTSSLATGSDSGKAPADQLAGAVSESILYATWAQATFGTGAVNEKVAKEYGPRLFKAAAYTRAEQAMIDADPSKAQALADLKREHYKEIAKEIEDKYPDVYQWVAGNQQQAQFGYTVAGVIGVLIALVFLIYALFRMAYAMIIVRLAVGVGPAVALVAAFPRLHHLVAALADVVLHALRSAAYFGAAGVIFTIVAVGTILSPSSQLHPVVKILAMLALTYAVWYGAKRLGIAALTAKAKQDAKEADSERRAEQPTPSASDPFTVPDRPNRSAPVEVGFVEAQSTRPTPTPGAGRAGVATQQLAAAGARTGIGAAKGATVGAAKGAVFTAATLGAGAGAIGTAAAKGAASGAAKGALGAGSRGAITAAATTASRRPKTATGNVVFHPSAEQKRPSSGAGPTTRPRTGRTTVSGQRVYTIYKAKAGAK